MYFDAIQNAQRVLRATAGYNGAIDGDPGVQSLRSARRVSGTNDPRRDGWPPARHVVAAAQTMLVAEGFTLGAVDGFYGPGTDAAYLAWRAAGRAMLGIPGLDRVGESGFGRQAEVEQRFGPAGAAACTAGRIVPPWRMVLAWDDQTAISGFNCHKDVAASGQRAFDRIASAHSLDQIRDLGLHLFGGCYNFRKKRGGSSLSTHASGLAIDFDPARNRLNWHRDRARLAEPDAVKFWDIWEDEGWTSLGRARDYDWMHVQAPAL